MNLMVNSSVKKQLFFLLIFTFLLLGYSLKDNSSSKPLTKVLFIDRVIDGDTLEANGSKFRLLGINTPEKNEEYYQEAKDYLSGFAGNYSVFEFYGEDKYGRNLGYLHFGDLLVNNELVLRGLASSYYYGDDDYKALILSSEKLAINNNLGIWKRSNNSCSSCFIISDFENGAGLDDCSAGVEFLQLSNICDYSCNINDWLLKDDTSSHIHTFSNISVKSRDSITIFSGEGKDDYSKNEFFFGNKGSCSSVWNDDGDSIFLRDENGGLVIFYRY